MCEKLDDSECEKMFAEQEEGIVTLIKRLCPLVLENVVTSIEVRVDRWGCLGCCVETQYQYEGFDFEDGVSDGVAYLTRTDFVGAEDTDDYEYIIRKRLRKGIQNLLNSDELI